VGDRESKKQIERESEKERERDKVREREREIPQRPFELERQF
jgi:hypothetical protein